MQYTGERPLTDVRVHLYPAHAPFDTSFTLYEDDGISFAYEANDYLRTRIRFRGTAAGEECVIERAAGTFAPPAGRAWTLELHGADVVAEVRINDVTVPKVASERTLLPPVRVGPRSARALWCASRFSQRDSRRDDQCPIAPVASSLQPSFS
jgi:hypothetical protein